MSINAHLLKYYYAYIRGTKFNWNLLEVKLNMENITDSHEEDIQEINDYISSNRQENLLDLSLFSFMEHF